MYVFPIRNVSFLSFERNKENRIRFLAHCKRYLLVAVEVHVVLLDDTPALGPVAGHEPALVPLLVEPSLTVARAQVLTAHPAVCPKDTHSIKPLIQPL